jgi:hypothetical protein
MFRMQARGRTLSPDVFVDGMLIEDLSKKIVRRVAQASAFDGSGDTEETAVKPELRPAGYA